MDEQRDHFKLNNIVRLTFFLKRNWILSYGNCSQNNILSVGINFIFQSARYAPVPLIHICNCHSYRIYRLDVQIGYTDNKELKFYAVCCSSCKLEHNSVCMFHCSSSVLILACKAFSIVRYLRWCLFKETFTFKSVLIWGCD